MKTEKVTAEERVAHTPRTNDTKIPWQSGIFQDNDGVRHLAIWPESIPLGTIANPVCLISAEATADNVDEANAAFIVTSCNAHEALVDALRAQINPGIVPHHEEYGCPVCKLAWHFDETDGHAAYPCKFGIAVKALGGVRAALAKAEGI